MRGSLTRLPRDGLFTNVARRNEPPPRNPVSGARSQRSVQEREGLGRDEAHAFGYHDHSAAAGVLEFALLAGASSRMSSSRDHRWSTMRSPRSLAVRSCSRTAASQSSPLIEITAPLAYTTYSELSYLALASRSMSSRFFSKAGTAACEPSCDPPIKTSCRMSTRTTLS